MIFVFGSNLAGRHGKGAALHARGFYDAALGVGVGRTGQAYAIPTKDEKLKTLPLDVIAKHVEDFLRDEDRVWPRRLQGGGHTAHVLQCFRGLPTTGWMESEMNALMNIVIGLIALFGVAWIVGAICDTFEARREVNDLREEVERLYVALGAREVRQMKLHRYSDRLDL